MDRLYRSSDQRMIAGVCGGFGEYFGLDPTIVRVIFVLVTIATGLVPGIVAYGVLWLIIPDEESVDRSVRESMRANVEEMAKSARDLGSGVQATFSGEKRPVTLSAERISIVGAALIIIGLLFLLGSLDFLDWLRWGRLWPLVIIGIGLFLLLRRRQA